MLEDKQSRDKKSGKRGRDCSQEELEPSCKKIRQEERETTNSVKTAESSESKNAAAVVVCEPCVVPKTTLRRKARGKRYNTTTVLADNLNASNTTVVSRKTASRSRRISESKENEEPTVAKVKKQQHVEASNKPLGVIDNTHHRPTLTKSKSTSQVVTKTESEATPYQSKLHSFYHKNYSTSGASMCQSMKIPLPQLTWANSHELWNAMRVKESCTYKHDSACLLRHEGIEPRMRAILFDWLVEVSHAYRLHRETFHLAVEFIDRFLSSSKMMRVDRLQLIGISALYLAAKVEEIYPPKLADFASHMDSSYSANNEECMVKFELFILKTLEWHISPCTCNTWLLTYLQIAAINFKPYLKAIQHGGDTLKAMLDRIENDEEDEPTSETMSSTRILIPLNLYKNSNCLVGSDEASNFWIGQFFADYYLKAITLLDLCLFDIESLKFGYSLLSASALYHTLSETDESSNSDAYYDLMKLVTHLVEKCTGYQLFELDSCIKWMSPFAQVTKDHLNSSDLVDKMKHVSNVDPSESHIVQFYTEYTSLMVNNTQYNSNFRLILLI